ncbi:toxin-antitoxin system YwqK family antitoxin [Sphingobacterium haloxyli]|uniref:Toxin-antitoxin system YwqK family antitoxin n=1 Tax=Sphingobacterium haloxyli TaxID=2100533 RepID=A0A2S9J0E8_9SPHI|nr:hypothetical protein [Sphingobacterium haloxyli]PRD46266.1 hypothetical protein C5745_15880 [Sphingobacterium haloxyli]
MKVYIPYSLLLSCFLLTVQGSYAQSEMDLLEQIQNRITINHDNGEKEVFTVTPKTTKAKSHRLYHWYQSQRVQRTQGGYTGKLLHGNYNRYAANKQLLLQGTYKKGLANGVWKEWRPNHRLVKEERWRKGLQDGNARHYDEQGNLLLRGKMKAGKWHGKVWAFDSGDSSYHWNYYDRGTQMSREEYTQANLFRRTGQFFERTWNNIFHRKPDDGNIVE